MTTIEKPTPAKTAEKLLERRQAAVPRGPFNVAPIFASEASGCHLWDTEGRRYIDFCGGIGAVNVGHNHPKVVAAVKAQAERLIHSSWHVAMYEPYVELAERLNELVPMPGPNKTAFFNSGAEAGENAVKIARVATGRPAVVTFERGFHGRTLLAMTMTGKVQPYTYGFGPFAPEVYRLPWEPFFGHGERSDEEVEASVTEALDRLFAYQIEPDRVACVVMEPVLGEGGFLPVRRAAVRLLRETCRENGILFASDEVQSGFGRCGAYFACQRYEIVPDMVILAKSLAGGMPLSAVTAPAEIMDAPQVGGLGGTYGGNPLSCAAGLAVLDVLEEEDLCRRALEIGRRTMGLFAELQARHPFLAHARGLGAMCGIEVIDPDDGRPDAGRAVQLTVEARLRGLLLMTASGNVIRTLMPLNTPDDELTRAFEILRDAAAALSRGGSA